MITNNVETFTAKEAYTAGIAEAIKNGSCVIEGSFKMIPEGRVVYKYTTFNFIDNKGDLRIGRLSQTFDDEAELSELVALISLEKIKENDDKND